MADEDDYRGVRESFQVPLAIGHFILQFSHAETWLNRVLQRLARVSDPVARAIFSGTRLQPMTDYIKAILANTEIPEQKTEPLRTCMSQLLAINNVRNDLVHYGANNFSAE